MDSESLHRPEFSGSFLFLVELARSFSLCNQARRKMDVQMLFRNIEAVALNLSGYYEDPAHEKRIDNDLHTLRVAVDTIARQNKGLDTMMIPKSIWEDLYVLEKYLRLVWKDSGLQMSIKDYSDDINTF